MRNPRAYRQLRIIAQDPSLVVDGKILTSDVSIPAEDLLPGPRGYRVHVIDYDVTRGAMYRPYPAIRGQDADPFGPNGSRTDEDLLRSPHFHAQNVYAIIMRTLCRFEKALGRRVSWSFKGHQLKAAPHAFVEANAFYSSRDEAVMFGYFVNAQEQPVFTCLSHDIIAHETAHALLDGLRERYIFPSGPEQAAFHEGFADVVAILSVFSLKEVMKYAVDELQKLEPAEDMVSETLRVLRQSQLFAMAEQFGTELGERFGALRRSVELHPDPKHLRERDQPHRLGEVLVAAMLHALLKAYEPRLRQLGFDQDGRLPASRVAEDGADIADRLLTMAIRAIDYCPPTDLGFNDYLSAILTADWEAQPDDSKYELRKYVRESFAMFGVKPKSDFGGAGLWEPPMLDLQSNERGDLVYSMARREALQRDPDEVFRFLWENRRLLKLCESAYTRVLAVRPCVRVSEEGFTVQETVADYVQILKMRADELSTIHVRRPNGVSGDTVISLYGGGALIFDDFGRLKYHIGNAVLNAARQSERLRYLASHGGLSSKAFATRPFAKLHLRDRVAHVPSISEESSRWSS